MCFIESEKVEQVDTVEREIFFCCGKEGKKKERERKKKLPKKRVNNESLMNFSRFCQEKCVWKRAEMAYSFAYATKLCSIFDAYIFLRNYRHFFIRLFLSQTLSLSLSLSPSYLALSQNMYRFSWFSPTDTIRKIRWITTAIAWMRAPFAHFFPGEFVPMAFMKYPQNCTTNCFYFIKLYSIIFVS